MTTSMSHLFQEDEVDIRQHLNEIIEQEKKKFIQQAQAFHDHGHHSKDQCLALTKSIIQTADNVIAAGDWQSSLFLRSTIKPLVELREEAIGVRDELLREQGLLDIEDYQLSEQEVKVYVSLYQADGHDMQAWAAQVASIRSYMSGRPIYKSEEDVRKAIRQKLLQTSEAYVVVAVSQDKLLGDEFASPRYDRNGCELLTIEAAAVGEEEVIEFVHLEKRYHYFNRKLVLKEKKQPGMWRKR